MPAMSNSSDHPTDLNPGHLPASFFDAGFPGASFLDTGLLSPVRAGTTAEGLVSDEAWLRAMLDAEVALVRVQSRLGVVPAEAAKLIEHVAANSQFDVAELARRARESANPVVPLVQDLTQAVAAVNKDAANYVHQGSTSQDIFDTATMLVASRSLRQTISSLDITATALATLTATHRHTLIAGRTLTQHAVPTTFGLKAAGWLVSIVESRSKLRSVRASLPIQLGGAAGTLAGYLEYAQQQESMTTPPADYATILIRDYAHELGLAEPVLPWHTLRGSIADLGAALSFTTGALGKIAVDVLSMTRTEVAEISEPAVVNRGTSSAMPQKRNPVLAAMIRSAALQVPATASILASSQIAEDERPAGVWQAEWQPLRECLRLTGAAAELAAELVQGLQVFPERMRDNLDLTSGLIVAERIAAVLTPTLGKSVAKDVVSRAARQAVEQDADFTQLLSSAPELIGVIDEEELSTLLEPSGYLGAADTLIDRALAFYASSG